MEQFRKSPRADFLDYNYGKYFITICTKNKEYYFGKITRGKMILSPIGQFVESQLKNASGFNSKIEVLVYVVMPNHIHAIVRLCRDVPLARMIVNPHQQRQPNPSLRANPTCQRHVPTLSKYINSLKGTVTKYAKLHNIDFVWQSRYHDHFIRGLKDENNIWNYIIHNVENWDKDCFYPNEL